MVRDKPLSAPGSEFSSSAPVSGRRPALAESIYSPGRVLDDRYRLDRQIGLGGMGEVWRARDLRLPREVAIKALRVPPGSADERLHREAAVLASLQHPALVEIYEVATDDGGRPFLVMELLDGEDLATYLDREGVLAPRVAVELLLPLLDVLHDAHRRGVIHRDLKPQNIFLCPTSTRLGWRAKLLDFGIAKTLAQGSMTRGLLGTPEYMAPEQLNLGTEIGPAVDQWAACVTLYEMIAGRQPFAAADPTSLFRRIREQPLPFPRDAPLDGRLFRVLAQGTRKVPEDRYASVRALIEALEAWLEGDRVRRDKSARASRSAPTGATPSTLDEVIHGAFREKGR